MFQEIQEPPRLRRTRGYRVLPLRQEVKLTLSNESVKIRSKFKKPPEIRRSELSINIVSADKSAEIHVIVYTIIYNGFGLFVGAVIHLETLGRILDADGVKPFEYSGLVPKREYAVSLARKNFAEHIIILNHMYGQPV